MVYLVYYFNNVKFLEESREFLGLSNFVGTITQSHPLRNNILIL